MAQGAVSTNYAPGSLRLFPLRDHGRVAPQRQCRAPDAAIGIGHLAFALNLSHGGDTRKYATGSRLHHGNSRFDDLKPSLPST